MATRIQLRRDTAANWNSFNPVLAQGEFGLDLDSNRIKLGDGTSTWSQLQYENWSLDLNDLDGVTITDVQNGDFLRYNSSASAWINDPVNLSTDTVGDYVQSLVAGTGVTVTNNSGEGTTPTIAIGQAVGTSSSVTFAHVSSPVTGNVIGDLTGNADTATTLETSRSISLSGDLSGSVLFDGSQDVTISATIQPNSVALGTDTTGNYLSNVVAGTGVVVGHTPSEGSSASISIGQDVSTSASVTFAHVSAEITGNITGNADTADSLSTARVISLAGDLSGSVSFDGSSNVTITAEVQPNSIALGTDTTGNYVSDVTGGTGVTVTHTPGEGSSPTIAIGQAVATSSSVTFAHISAPVTGNVTGDVSGNAGTATALQNARAISLGGDLSGSASFNGTSDITITAQVQPNSVALGTDTTGNYVNDVVAGTGISVTHTPGEGSSASVALNAWLNDLGDVVIVGSPERFQTLGYDGAGWVNSYAPVVSYVRNAEATTLTVGTVVYLFGGTGDHASVKRASNASDTTSSKTVGIVGTAIAAGQNGPVITRGYASGMNLSAYSEGDVLWLGTNGGFTTTKPSAPDHLVFVGVVVRATNNGIIYVATQNGYELEELHNVKINGVTDGQFLRYNSASTVWVNDTINLGSDTAGDYVQSLVAGTGVTLSNNSGESATPTIAIGQNIATSASVTFAHLTVQGDMEVQGTITRVNETNLDVAEAFIYLNSNSASANPDMGVAFNYNDGTYRHAGIFRDASDGKFKIFDSYEPEPETPINTSDASYNDAEFQAKKLTLTQSHGIAPIIVSSSTVVTNLNADKLDGQDSTYFAPINSPTFTGTVTLPNNTVALGTQTTGNYVADVSGGTGVNVTHTPGEGTTPSIAIGQDVATSASVTFAHVSAPVTGNLTGNASTASTLQTSRAISLSGDLSGSVSFNGSSDVSINATIQPNSVALGTDTTGNYMSDLTQGTGVTITHTPGEGSNATIAIGQSVATSASVTFAHVSADLTGNVTGNVTGNSGTATSLETARAISLAGDLSGSVSFNGTSDATITADIQPNSVALGTDTTGNYVSDVTAGTGVTVTHTPGEGSSPTIAIGQAVGTSSSVQFGQVTTTGDVVVGGNLTVNGTQTVLNTDVLAVEDNFIILNAGVSGAPTLNAGIDVNRGSSPDVSILWNEDADSWQATENGTNFYDIAFGQNVFTSSSVQFANVTSNLLGDVTGKADRADRLEVGRTISLAGDLSGSVAFDGTQNVTLNATIQSNSVALGSDTTGSYVESLVAGTGITLSNNSGESATPTVAIGQDVGTSASVTFANVTADLVGNVTGNASTATALQNTRTISLSGDVTGSASFNGSSDATIVVTIPADSIVLGTDTTGNYVADVTAGTGIGVSHIDGEGSAPEISLNAYLNDINDVNLTVAPTDGQFLKYVSASTAWIAANIPTINSLDDIADVTITSASVSQVLQWNGTAWVNANPGATVTVSDTAPGSPTEGDLWFDSTTLDTFVRYDSAWIQLNDSGSPIEVLDDLFDVSVLDAEPDQFLKYDGTDWVPASPVLPVSINTRTANYTLTLSDVNRLVEMNLSGANTVTVPTNANQAIPIGSKIEIFQYGSGKTQIIGDTGVTIRATPGSYLNAQYSYATLVKRGTNEWILFGDLSAS